jgi:hypothetical protein
MAIYLHDWFGEDGFRKMVLSFEDGSYSPSEQEIQRALSDEKYQGINVLLASYCYENYSGDAFVLFERGGKLFEVHGAHCSCYGLEYQWSPEETTIEALRHRLDKGSLGRDDWSGNQFAHELRVVLDSISDRDA